MGKEIKNPLQKRKKSSSTVSYQQWSLSVLYLCKLPFRGQL